MIAAGAAIPATLPAQAGGYKWTGISVYAGGGGAVIDGNVGLRDSTAYEAKVECEKEEVPNFVPLLDTIDTLGFLKPPPPPHKHCHELGPITKSFANALEAALNGDPGALGTVGVSADYEIMPRFVVGAFADVDWSNASSSFSGSASSGPISYGASAESLAFVPYPGLTATTTINGKLDYDYSYTIGGRLGFVSIDRRAMMYVLGGYTWVHTEGYADVNTSIDGFIHPLGHIGFDSGPVRVGLPKTYEGGTIGVGGEVKLTNLISLKLEGRYTNLQAQSVSYSYSSESKQENYAPGCGGGPPGPGGPSPALLPPPPKPCKATLVESAESTGTIDVNPDIWSGRIALSIKFD